MSEATAVRGLPRLRGGTRWGDPGSEPPLPLPADHKAFYVIFTWDQEAQIYELVAQTVSERKK